MSQKKQMHTRVHCDPAVSEFKKALELAESTQASSEVISALKSGLALIYLREEFTHNATSPQTKPCESILDETYSHDWKALHDQGKTTWKLDPEMMTGPLEGQFLKSLVSIHNAKRVLDIGMFTGYSALSMAEALPADGQVVTIDQDEYLKEFVGETLLSQSPHHKKIKILIGKAPELLQQMVDEKEVFDIIFLDADKSEYSIYFKLNLLRPGGTVLVDNAYRYGDGYNPATGENVTKKFVKSVVDDQSLHSVLVPIRDGILMIRRKSDVEGHV